MRGLQGKVVVVTGGGGGIGSATCRRFAEEGARVVVADISAEAAARVTDELRASGADAAQMVVDLTDAAATEAAIARLEAGFGPVDVLVNNAGWDLFVPFLKSDPDYWTKIIDTRSFIGRGFSGGSRLPAMFRRPHQARAAE